MKHAAGVLDALSQAGQPAARRLRGATRPSTTRARVAELIEVALAEILGSPPRHENHASSGPHQRRHIGEFAH